jgi:hypothetical protein
MKQILIAAVLFALGMACGAASATTYYIRTDGGTATQCTGTTNAAYPGSGSAQACGFNHPFWLLNQGTFNWNISAGDTVKFEDTGPYYIGQGPLNGLGQNWTFCNGQPNACNMPALPNNVSFLGACAPTCANSGHTGLVGATQLIGINQAQQVLSVSGTGNGVTPGSSGVTIDGFDITQPDMCTISGGGGVPSGSVTAWSISGNVATFTASSTATFNLAAGNWTQLHGFGTSTFFNGQWVQVLSSGLSTSQFEANFTHANGSATEAGAFGIECVNGLNNYVVNSGMLLSFANNFGPSNSTIKELQIHGLANQAVTGGKMNILGSITAWSITSGVATFTAANTLSAGNVVTPLAFPTSSFFNGHNCTVLSSGLSTSQFEVTLSACTPSITHANGSATEAAYFGNANGTMHFSDIYMWGNANTGWNGDAGGCTTNCESAGTMTLSYIQALWSGCMEVKPNGGTVGGNGANLCVDQTYTGNGDNIVMIATGGTWNWDHILTKWGAQDGFDGYHVGDDLTSGASTVTNVVDSEGNEGQQWKVSGPVVGTNMRLIANCRRLLYPFSPNPTGYNGYVGLTCRAYNGVTMVLAPGQNVTFSNNTLVGYANPLIDFECYGSSNPANCPANSMVLTAQNNVFLGYPDPYSGNAKPGGFYFGYTPSDPFSWTGSVASNNVWAPNTIKPAQYGGSPPSSGCPNDPNETSVVCSDPLMYGESTADSYLDNFNINLQSGSPAIAAGVNNGVTPDFNGNARANPYTIGAVNYVASGGGTVVGGSTILGGGTIW